MPKRQRPAVEREPDFEARPRQLAQQGSNERDLLPVNEDGKWKRVKAKHTKASRAAEEGEEAEELPSSSPTESSDAAERQRELERIARKVEEDAATVQTKKVSIAKLGRQIIEAPQKHIGLLKELLDMANRDRSPVVQRLALLSCISSLLDLMPAYRIRLATDKELAMQVSTEVGALRTFEKKFLESYEGCVGTLGRWLKSPLSAHRTAAVRAVCELLRKGFDFNFRDEVVASVVALSRSADEETHAQSCAALVEMFGADTHGEATLVAVKAMSAMLKNNSFNVPAAVLECWLHLKLDGAALEAPMNRRQKQKAAALDPVARELAQAAGERGNRGRMQAQILEHVFVAYARVVRNGAHSPLLSAALRGIAEYAHQVNIELLLDLFTSMRGLLQPDAGLSVASTLQCVHALLRLLAGHGQALNVDTKDVQVRLYALLNDQQLLEVPQLLATALDCIEHLCKRSRSSLLPARSASITRRLLAIACVAPHAQAVAVLCVISRLLLACPRIATLLQPAEAGCNVHAMMLVDGGPDDPDATAALRSTAWHVALLRQHYHPTVRELAAKLAAQEPFPPRFVNATPLKLMSSFDQETGNFQPPPPQPKPHRFAAALKADPGALKMLGAVPGSALVEVRNAGAAALTEGACSASFGVWFKRH